MANSAHPQTIAYVVPGTGGAFYCENCVRDCAMIAALRQLGHRVVAVPMYLPLSAGELAGVEQSPIFFGAMRLYLTQQVPFLRRLPRGALSLLDSDVFLRLASAMAGSTAAAGHEELTLTMLWGLKGSAGAEFEKLGRWLASAVRPDIVIISNAFLLGVAAAVKAFCGARVGCFLQDEHVWVEASAPRYRAALWQAAAVAAGSADALLTPGQWYRSLAASSMNIPPERIHAVAFGVDPQRYQPASHTSAGVTIGMLGRLDTASGVDTIADAFRLLSRRTPDIRLALCGGYSSADRATLTRALRGIGRDRVSIETGWDTPTRSRFLTGIDILSTPVHDGVALGVFLLEAMAAQVPVVQPDSGGFTEIITRSGGGILYRPNTPETLAGAIEALLADPEQRRKLGRNGRAAIESTYNHVAMARSVIALIEEGSHAVQAD